MNKTYEIDSGNFVYMDSNNISQIEKDIYSPTDLNYSNIPNNKFYCYSNNDIYIPNYVNENISTKTTPNFYNKPKLKRNRSYKGKINLLKLESDEYLNKLDKTLNDIEINRNNLDMDKILNAPNQNSNNNNDIENKKYFLLNDNKINDIKYEIDNLQSKYIALSNDNIMLKEDIYRLTDINKNLEREIDTQRKHNLFLVEENSNINEQNMNLKDKINNANSQINLIKSNINKYKKVDLMRDKIYYKDLQLKKEYNYKKLMEDKNKFEIDIKLLKEKFILLEDKNNKISNELNLLKNAQDNKLNDLENQVTEVLKEINNLKNENIKIQKENNSLKIKFSEINEEKNNYCRLYNYQKVLNNNLKKEISNIKQDFEEYKTESIIAKNENIKKNKMKKEKNNLKKEIISNLKKKINDYKEMQMKYKYID